MEALWPQASGLTPEGALRTGRRLRWVQRGLPAGLPLPRLTRGVQPEEVPGSPALWCSDPGTAGSGEPRVPPRHRRWRLALQWGDCFLESHRNPEQPRTGVVWWCTSARRPVGWASCCSFLLRVYNVGGFHPGPRGLRGRSPDFPSAQQTPNTRTHFPHPRSGRDLSPHSWAPGHVRGVNLISV